MPTKALGAPEETEGVCGRFTLSSPRDLVERRFQLDLVDAALPPRYNIAPRQRVITAAIGREGSRRAVEMLWGLVPPGSPEPSTKLSTINARIESAATSRLYGPALRRHRCLVLADGYYEWQAVSGERRKRPHWIARADRAPFAFAGIFSIWRPPGDGDPIPTCSIVTTEAVGSLAAIHARMPVILRPEVEAAWIDRELTDPESVLALLVAPDGAAYTAHVVSGDVGSPRNDRPELILPADR